ncbi:MAG: L-rhamnose mutarotase, partial [Bacteroidales bacterium]|nr:L-rhamnose mutarotase [Bacteroidales bacterium]
MEGYEVKRYGVPARRYCQTLDLRHDPELIAEYQRLHGPEG